MNKRRIILSVSLPAAWVPALIGYAALAAEKPGGMKRSVIVSAAAEGGASPLNSFMITPSSVNCVQGRLAIGADGTVGIPAPVNWTHRAARILRPCDGRDLAGGGPGQPRRRRARGARPGLYGLHPDPVGTALSPKRLGWIHSPQTANGLQGPDNCKCALACPK